jgi:hypothetical protein
MTKSFSIYGMQSIAGEGAILFGSGSCKMGLFTNAITPNYGSHLSDFTAATFPGYTAQDFNIGFDAGFDGTQEVYLCDPVQWMAGTIVSSQTVHGFYIYDDTDVIYSESFDVPIVVNTTGQRIVVATRVNWKNG